ncbi:hypothetical protein [Vibrio profundi]|uniref:hypothetical protein n=1 Tax=Vibrio profundi TaxID=1774960 RepID=UPI0037354F00
MISHAKNIESLYEHFSHQFLALERMIVIDISTSWEKELCQLSELESSILIGDVRLLADIYWLDEFEIMTDKEQSVFHGFAPLESSLNKEKNVALH